MAGTTLDVTGLLNPDSLACSIAQRWTGWNTFRSSWVEQTKELRNYIFATDTRTTGNKKLPWANSTTTPKLTQIYDNLKANYTAALFPNSNWMKWEAQDKEADTKAKAIVIQGYMKNKVKQSNFELTADRLIDDFILFGNCFATVEYARETTELPDGTFVPNYIGPKVVRISPYDIVFNPVAADFKSTPKRFGPMTTSHRGLTAGTLVTRIFIYYLSAQDVPMCVSTKIGISVQKCCPASVMIRSCVSSTISLSSSLNSTPISS